MIGVDHGGRDGIHPLESFGFSLGTERNFSLFYVLCQKTKTVFTKLTWEEIMPSERRMEVSCDSRASVAMCTCYLYMCENRISN